MAPKDQDISKAQLNWSQMPLPQTPSAGNLLTLPVRAYAMCASGLGCLQKRETGREEMCCFSSNQDLVPPMARAGGRGASEVVGAL